MARRPPLDIAEFGRRLALFQRRPPPPKKMRTSLEAALLALFESADAAHAMQALEPWEAELLSAARTAWRRQRALPAHFSFFERVFDTVPTPVAVFCHETTLWNQAFVACLDAADELKGTERRVYVERLAKTVREAGELRAPALYHALGRRLYRVTLRAFPDLDCSAAYLFPDGRALPDLDPVAQQLLAYRLSGLSLKQIAPLLGVSYSRVEGISKRSRRHLMRMRSESCPEAVS